MNNNHLKQLRKILTKLGRKDSVPVEKGEGVCGNVMRMCAGLSLDAHYPHYITVIRNWKYYSGDYLFPIPCPREFSHTYPGLYYIRLYNKWEGEQGELRRKFCRYLVRELNKYCKANGIKL